LRSKSIVWLSLVYSSLSRRLRGQRIFERVQGVILPSGITLRLDLSAIKAFRIGIFNQALGASQMMDLPAVSIRLAGLPKASTRA
jgi:hypothetical protein